MQALDQQWYAVALSEEIPPGKPYRLRFYAREIALWRQASGSLVALDSRCPHMGASLALGRVHGDGLACPYHGFEFDPQGKCRHTPRRHADALIPITLQVRSWAVAEKGGWVFLFWGDRDQTLPDIPYFDEIDGNLRQAWSVRQWPVHFTRFIENTVDIAHLGTVHRNTLSWTIPAVADDFECQVDGNFINIKPPSATDLPVASRIAYPNMALLFLHPKFLTVFVGVPLDDENTRIYVRSAQGIFKLPLLHWPVTLIKHWADMAALWQDKQPLLSTRPKNADEAKGEVCLEIDRQIVEYRKMRRRLKTSSSKDSNH